MWENYEQFWNFSFKTFKIERNKNLKIKCFSNTLGNIFSRKLPNYVQICILDQKVQGKEPTLHS